MGVVVWPMVKLEADDGLASGGGAAADDQRVEKVCIWTPDKDLAQRVVGERVVQVDRKIEERSYAMRRVCARNSVWRRI